MDAFPTELGWRRRLTLVEELILASDRPAAPVTVGLVATTSTRLDARRLDAALADAVAAHPLVAARLALGAAGHTWRTPSDARIATIEVAGATESASFDVLARACSYTFTDASEGRLRVLVVRRPAGDALVLAAHHAAVDGDSLVTLLNLITQSYVGTDPRSGRSVPTQRTPTPAPAPVPTPAKAQPQAQVQPPSRPGRRRSLPILAARIAPERTAHPLVTWIRRRLATASAVDPYGVHGATVDVPRLPRAPDGVRPTVNDALVAAAHLAVERWNTSRHRPTRTVRLRTSSNLRTETQTGLVANLSGEIMVASSATDRALPVALLTEVSRQTTAAKARAGSRPQPVDSLQLLNRLSPRARGLVLRAAVASCRRALMPTATVTNLGRVEDPLRATVDNQANPLVKAVHFAAFAGPPQGMVVAAAGYGGRLHLTFAHHTSMLDGRAASRFAAVYLDALRDVCEGWSSYAGGAAVAPSDGSSTHSVTPSISRPGNPASSVSRIRSWSA